ncbi:hypothetical protein [Cryptosporangium sp. NPDC051539]|uniref:hypothetical protein n=1 Tax=Cryptosporangium sp. NPDC051539 TaxID=3363962 RepID=UPI0037AC0970
MTDFTVASAPDNRPLSETYAGALDERRTLWLSIRKSGEKLVVDLFAPGEGGHGSVTLSSEADLPAEEIREQADALRRAWFTSLRDFVPGRVTSSAETPLIRTVDFRSLRGPQLDAVWWALAKKGSDLFRDLFTGGVRKWIETALWSELEQVITVRSEYLHAPWPMLYLPPENQDVFESTGKPAPFEGFLGYRHLIEHALRDQDGRPAPISPDGTMTAGVYMDKSIDDGDDPVIAPIITLLRGSVDDVVEHEDKSAFKPGLGDLAEQIMYFCCHTDTETDNAKKQYLKLTDQVPVSAPDVRDWLNGKQMSKPLVVMNTCKGGLSSVNDMSHTIVRSGAGALIGPQIIAPRKFAGEFAAAFLKELFGPPPARVGRAARYVARLFVENQDNPLGLTYLVYQGMDMQIRREAATA